MVFDLTDPINAGFMISVAVSVVYWSSTLTEEGIIERANRHGLRFFGSMPRIAGPHCAISLAIRCLSLIAGSAWLYNYLATNTIAMPLFLIAGMYVLRSAHMDLRLALWRYSDPMKKAGLDGDQFICSLTKLVQRMRSGNRLESFVRTYAERNPSMVPLLRTPMQKLEAEGMVPTSLSIVLAGLLTD